MKVSFADKQLERLESELRFTAGFDRSIVKAFRKRLEYIRNALDERDLFVWKSLRYERLKGNRQHQHSMRLNKQWRLIVEWEQTDPKTLVIVAIEDYH